MTVQAAEKRTLVDAARNASSYAAEAEGPGWGHLPALGLIGACGLLLVACAYTAGRADLPVGTLLRWIGLLLLFVPTAFRLLSPAAARRERIGLLVVLAMNFYLVKVLYSPLEFRFSDEFQHWRSTDDIMQTGRLFQFQHFLPTSLVYPALQNVMVALISLTGLDIFSAGIVVMGLVRLLFVLALYLFYEQALDSAYVAGIASLLYMANPHYQFLNAMFTYQAFALPILAYVLFIIARKQRTHDVGSVGLHLALLLSLVTVVISHHLTSYLLLAFLVLWTLATFWRQRKRNGLYEPHRPEIGGTTILLFVLIVTWLVYVATVTVGYLVEPVSAVASELISLTTREANPGAVFRPPQGPSWERYTSYAAVGVLLIGLALGTLQIARKHQRNALVLALGLGSFGYLGGVALRFTSGGAELAGRSFPFTFLPLAFVLAVGLAELSRLPRRPWIAQLVLVLPCIGIYLGGLTSGWPPYWARLPGPYLVEASERSIEPQGVEAAKWARSALGRNNRMATNFTNFHLMGSYGAQDPVFGTSALFFAPRIGSEQVAEIRQKELDYFVVDKRLSSMLPVRGFYFEGWEAMAQRYTEPIAPGMLAKFDGVPNVSRVFDSGDIVIYDVRTLSHGP